MTPRTYIYILFLALGLAGFALFYAPAEAPVEEIVSNPPPVQNEEPGIGFAEEIPAPKQKASVVASETPGKGKVESPSTDSAVIEFVYPVGFTGGRAPKTEYYSAGNATKFTADFWWKVSENWQGHESNVNKVAFVYADKNNGDVTLVMYGTPGGPYELRTVTQFKIDGGNMTLLPNIAHIPVTLGAWHHIVWSLDYNGEVKWWLDGTLIGDYKNVVFPPEPMNEFQLSPTWGGIGDVKKQTDYVWFKDVSLKP